MRRLIKTSCVLLVFVMIFTLVTFPLPMDKQVFQGNFFVNPIVLSKSFKESSVEGLKIEDVTKYYKGYNFAKILSTKSITSQATWANCYGGSKDDELHFIKQTKDGGFIVAGYTVSFGAGESDFLVIKLTQYGEVVWAKTYGGNSYDVPNSFQEIADGFFIVG